MEALTLILVGAIEVLIAPVISVIGLLLGGFFSFFVSLLFDLIGILFAGRPSTTKIDPSKVSVQKEFTAAKSAGKKAPLPPIIKRGRHPWTHWMLIGSATTTALIFLTLFVINQWFLNDIAQGLLVRQRDQTGIAITAKTIDGNLFTGKFTASGIIVKRGNHPAGLIDLSVGQVTLSMPVWRIFAHVIAIDVITVDGVQGKYERGIPGQAPAVKQKDDGVISIEDDGEKTSLTVKIEKKKRREFQVSALTINNVNVNYTDHTRKHPLSIPVTIEKLTANPLRNRWAIFDVLFRANANGTIAGRPFRLTTTGDDLGRSTTWTADDLPVALLAHHIGGPFTLLNDGTCYVRVTDRWQMSNDQRMIVMDWSMVLNHVTAAVPESTRKPWL